MKIQEVLNEAYDPFDMDDTEDEFPEPKIKIKNIIGQLQAAQDAGVDENIIDFVKGSTTLSLNDITSFLNMYYRVKNKKKMTDDASTSVDGLVNAFNSAKKGAYGFDNSPYSGMRPSTKSSTIY